MIGEKVLKEISLRIKENSEKVRYGTVSVSVKIHEGHAVVISHEITETTKHKEVIHE
jgi:hypothetical protein